MSPILCDYRERRSAVPDLLEEMGIPVELTQLGAGDYVISDRLAVERKSASDLVASIKDRRLNEQTHRLHAVFPAAVLLIEGWPIPFPERSWRSALAGAVSLGGVSVLHSDGPEESAEWIALLAKRENRPPSRERLPSRKPTDLDQVSQRLLMMLPGISAVGACRMLEHFGSLGAVLRASEQQLRDVEGIGPKRAQSLVSLLDRSWRAPEDPLAVAATSVGVE